MNHELKAFAVFGSLLFAKVFFPVTLVGCHGDRIAANSSLQKPSLAEIELNFRFGPMRSRTLLPF